MRSSRLVLLITLLSLSVAGPVFAQIAPEQALVAARYLLQFECDGKTAAKACRLLTDATTIGRPEARSHALGLLSNDALVLDPQNHRITYQNVSEDLQLIVNLEGGDYRVWVQFPERTKPYSVQIPCTEAETRLHLAKVRDVARKMAGDPKYQAWRSIPEEDGSAPDIPLPSRILAADAYDKLFADGLLDIVITYGYLDHEPSNEPTDFMQAKELRATLKKKGFSVDAKDEWLLTRAFIYNGKPMTCRVWIAHSAVPEKLGPDAQVKQSMKARNLFMGGLEHADVVMYDGHSRLGRGPDFTAHDELKSPGNIKIGPMVPFYLEFGDNFMLRFVIPFSGGRDFKDDVFAKTRYQILVMDSCKSEAYYRRRVLRDAIKYSGKTDEMLDLITTDTDADMADSLHTKMAVISGLMAARTAPELDVDLNTGVVTRYNTTGLFVDRDVDTPFDQHQKQRGGAKKKTWFQRLGRHIRDAVER